MTSPERPGGDEEEVVVAEQDGRLPDRDAATDEALAEFDGAAGDPDRRAVEAAHDLVEDAPVVAPAEARRVGSLAARLAASSRRGSENITGTAPGTEDNETAERRRGWTERGREAIATAARFVGERWQRLRTGFTERVGTWAEIRDAARAVGTLGRNLVTVGVGAAASARETAGHHGRNALDAGAAARHGVVGMAHDVRGEVRGALARGATGRADVQRDWAEHFEVRSTERRGRAGAAGTNIVRGIGNAIGAALDERRARGHRAQETRHRNAAGKHERAVTTHQANRDARFTSGGERLDQVDARTAARPRRPGARPAAPADSGEAGQ
jgi:hypothetical protein